MTKALGAVLDSPAVSYTSAEQMLARQAGKDDSQDEAVAGSGVSPEQQAETTAEVKNRHYRKALSEPIPILNNRSPRDCLGDPAGREQVITWLKHLENNEQRMARRSGQPVYDTRWLCHATVSITRTGS